MSDVIIDLGEQKSKEYQGCGHSAIRDWGSFTAIVSGVSGLDLPVIRKSLHQSGHLEIWDQGQKVYPAIRDLHTGLEQVCAQVMQSSLRSTFDADHSLQPIDAQMSALQLRLTSIGLIEKTGQVPDLEVMKSVWSQIASHPDEDMTGVVAANVMAIFKKADEAQTHKGDRCQYARSSEFAAIIMQTSDATLNRNAPSPLRRWFVQTLYSGYHNALHRQYPLMLKFGSIEEIDVALSSLEILAANKSIAGSNLQELIRGYQPALQSLSDGANVNADLIRIGSYQANYGNRESLLAKTRKLLISLRPD